MKLADDGDHFTKLAHKEPEPVPLYLKEKSGHPLGQFSEINKVGSARRALHPSRQALTDKRRGLKERANGNRRSDFRRQRQRKSKLLVSRRAVVGGVHILDFKCFAALLIVNQNRAVLVSRDFCFKRSMTSDGSLVVSA